VTPGQLDAALRSVQPALQRSIRALLSAWERLGRRASLRAVEEAVRSGNPAAIIRAVLGDAAADTVTLTPAPFPDAERAFAATTPAAIAAASRSEAAVIQAAADAAVRASTLASAALPPRPPGVRVPPLGAPAPLSGVLVVDGPNAIAAARDARATARTAVRQALASPPPGARAFGVDALRYLRSETHAGIMAAVREGNARGINPRDIARGLRDVVGLGESQAVWVENLRAELEAGEFSDALQRKLVDGVSARTIKARMASKKPLTGVEIDKIVGRYAESWRSWHAETIARTASLDLLRHGTLAKALEAQRSGVYGDEPITKRWVTRIDGRERDAHRALNNSTIAVDGYWFDDGVPRRTPGGWNCRCSLVIRVGV
jgi:hypothetical protein